MTSSIHQEVSYLIPLCVDSPDRVFNLQTELRYLNKHCPGSHVLIAEEHGKPALDFFADEFVQSLTNLKIGYFPWHGRPDGLFHRTRILNCLASVATTQIVVYHDSDVFFSPLAYSTAARTILERNQAVVWPYNSPTFDIPKNCDLRTRFAESLDLSEVAATVQHPRKPHTNVGGSIFVRKTTIEQIGGFSDDFISWGSEDEEFAHRCTRLKLPMARVEGRLYHLAHDRGPNSVDTQPYRISNMQKHHAMLALKDDALHEYVADLVRKYNQTTSEWQQWKQTPLQ